MFLEVMLPSERIEETESALTCWHLVNGGLSGGGGAMNTWLKKCLQKQTLARSTMEPKSCKHCTGV